MASPTPTRRAATLLALAIAASLLAWLPAGVASATTVADGGAADPSAGWTAVRAASDDEPVDPRSLDYPTLPAQCATREQIVPKVPKRCVIARAGRTSPTLVLWGDSHLFMMLPAIQAAARGRNLNVVAFFFGGCVPARPDMRIYAGQPCAETSVLAMRHLEKLQRQGRTFRLLLGSFWGFNLNRVFWFPTPELAEASRARVPYTQQYTRGLFDWLGRRGIPTDVLSQGPLAVPEDPGCTTGPTPFECDIPRRQAYFQERYVQGWLKRQVRQLPRGARIISYADAVCSATTCRARQPGGVQTWYDAYHVSASRAAQLGRFFAPTVRAIYRRPAR